MGKKAVEHTALLVLSLLSTEDMYGYQMISRLEQKLSLIHILQVVSLVNNYFKKDEIIKNIYVFDNGLIKGFIQMNGTEICKLYVDTFFQSQGIGNELIEFAIKELHANNLWALEKNIRAISFYQRHGFRLTGQKKFEEDTTEYLVKLER